MTPASQAAHSADLAALAMEPAAHASVALHAPSPGATATLIHDLRELFKVKVVGLVLVTGWGGFYLGSMQSGISSMQRGLLDTLLGIGLVSAGAGALNQALERTTDARMKRTADRPLASGRFSLARVLRPGMGALAAGRLLAAAAHQSAHRGPGAAYCIYLRRHLHAAQARHHPGHLHRRVSRRHGADAGLDGARGRRSSGRPWRCSRILFVWQFPHFMSIAWLYRDDYARAGIRMLPVVQPDGWSTVVEALFYAVLMIPVSLAPWRLGMAGTVYAVLAVSLGLVYLAYTIRFARHPARQVGDPRAACWRATCSR